MFYVWQKGNAVYVYSTNSIVALYTYLRHQGGEWTAMVQHNDGFDDITAVVLENL